MRAVETLKALKPPLERKMTDAGHSGCGGAGLRKLAIRASLSVAVVLVFAKLAAWVITGSVALLTSAIDALVDTASSLVTFFGVRYAERPADLDHRFGHGKGEAISGFTQAAFLAGAALVLAFQSGFRLIYPEPVQSVDFGLLVILLSLLAAAGLVVLQTWVLKRTGSTAIAADRAHYLTDVAVNVGVLAALGVTRITGWERADPAFAVAISLYMLWNAYGITKEAFVQLLDRELPAVARQQIKDAVLACEGAASIHDLRTRYAGDRTFVEYHLEVNGRLSVTEGHDIGDATELAVAEALLGKVEVIAHIEPSGIQDQRLDYLVHGAAEPARLSRS